MPVPSNRAQFTPENTLKRCEDLLTFCKRNHVLDLKVDVRDFENLVSMARQWKRL